MILTMPGAAPLARGADTLGLHAHTIAHTDTQALAYTVVFASSGAARTDTCVSANYS